MLSKHLELLKKLNLSIRTQMDVAECYIPAINLQIENICDLDLLPPTALMGSIILDRAYGLGGYDSGQFIQAALLTPSGLGICVWDSEEYLEIRRTPDGIEYQLAKARFKKFDACEPAIKGLLLAHADKLLDRLLKLIGETDKKAD